MKERPAAHKNTREKPVQPQDTGNCIVYTLSIVSYHCYVVTAEWLSSAVENIAGKAQCCNPVLFIAKANISFFEI